MPELPEVATYKTYFDGTSLHQKITDIQCADERLLKKDFDTFKDALIGQEFAETQRIGKYLFAKTTGEKSLVLHFGMTGRLKYYRDPEDRPKYAHIVYSFDSGFHLGFLNKRKFGWNDLADSIDDYQSEVGLSKDAMDLTFEDFQENIAKRKTYIKPVLMDQSVAAGMGNWLVDEVLYQSGVHPEHKLENMDAETIRHIYDTMQRVLKVTVEKQAVYRDFPEDYFIHIRKKGAKCHHTNSKIEKLEVGGRATYYSPGWQQLP